MHQVQAVRGAAAPAGRWFRPRCRLILGSCPLVSLPCAAAPGAAGRPGPVQSTAQWGVAPTSRLGPAPPRPPRAGWLVWVGPWPAAALRLQSCGACLLLPWCVPSIHTAYAGFVHARRGRSGSVGRGLPPTGRAGGRGRARCGPDRAARRPGVMGGGPRACSLPPLPWRLPFDCCPCSPVCRCCTRTESLILTAAGAWPGLAWPAPAARPFSAPVLLCWCCLRAPASPTRGWDGGDRHADGPDASRNTDAQAARGGKAPRRPVALGTVPLLWLTGLCLSPDCIGGSSVLPHAMSQDIHHGGPARRGWGCWPDCPPAPPRPRPRRGAGGGGRGRGPGPGGPGRFCPHTLAFCLALPLPGLLQSRRQPTSDSQQRRAIGAPRAQRTGPTAP